MYRNSLFLGFVIVILLAATMAGCTTNGGETGPTTGLVNPASVYCKGLGFEEETREGDLGQYGVCLFPDGSECDTWGFLAGRCGQEHTYCIQQGYELEATEDGNIATCIFDDGSTCSEFMYFQEECEPGENMP